MSWLVKCDEVGEDGHSEARVVIAELNLGTPALAKWYRMVPAFLLASLAD